MTQRLLSTLLALCMALALLPGTALAAETSGTCGDNLRWSYSNGTLTIQGTGRMDDFITDRSYYPDTDSSTFTLSMPWIDYREQIYTVNIGDGVTSIGSAAFHGCNNMTSVDIPNSVTTIGEMAFSVCESLTSVTIPNSVTSIGEYAFKSAGLVSVNIPDSVTTIGEYAFGGCHSLTSITIPGSVASIGIGAFSNTQIANINVDSASQYFQSIDGVLFNAAATMLHIYPEKKENTFYSIPDTVTEISDWAFINCILPSVAIPKSVTSIGEYAFFTTRAINDVYYAGSEADWARIRVSKENDRLAKATIHYNSTGPAPEPAPEQPAPAATPAPTPAASAPSTGAVLSPQKLTVDGVNVDCEKYNIGGSNYFKLRDLAYALSYTASRFAVGFDEGTSTVSITTGEAYMPNGTELVAGVDNASTAQPSSQAILINGVERSDLTVYNIGGSNFFQLRELGNALGFAVDFDADTNTAIVRSTQG